MISTYSNYSKSISMIRPRVSQRLYWFDKKYFTESRFSFLDKEAVFSWSMPGEKPKRTKVVKLNGPKKLYCYLGQIIDCIKETSFFEQSRMKKRGTVNFSLIFDGYPIFNEQFNITKIDPIVESSFSFEKK